MATPKDWDAATWSVASRFGVAVDWRHVPLNMFWFYYDGAQALNRHEREIGDNVEKQ
jgi:hypothetical protein